MKESNHSVPMSVVISTSATSSLVFLSSNVAQISVRFTLRLRICVSLNGLCSNYNKNIIQGDQGETFSVITVDLVITCLD